MKTDEARIDAAAILAHSETVPIEFEAVALAICEVARQLARIADAYEEAHK